MEDGIEDYAFQDPAEGNDASPDCPIRREFGPLLKWVETTQKQFPQPPSGNRVSQLQFNQPGTTAGSYSYFRDVCLEIRS